MPEQHQMVPIGTTAADAQEWHCPQCGRAVLIRYPPRFEAFVIEEGDPSVPHHAVTGGAQKGRINEDARLSRVTAEEERWLNRIGVDWRGQPPDQD